MAKLNDELCCAAMKGQWLKVYVMLQENMRLCTAKITATSDTVFHMAMYAPEWSKKEVANMVDLCETRYIVDEETGERTHIHVLGTVNADGNTPLHLAASIGNVEMCKKIGGVDNYSLIGKRNNDGETPIFLAALYGQRNAFLWLHYYYMKRPGASPIERTHCCIRNNKDSILHCAIDQEHFDVAIEILHLYEDLVDATKENHEGLTPLHLLAQKPSAFKTGTLLGRPFGQIAYLLLGDMKKEKATTEEELEKSERKSWVMLLKDAVVNKWMSETKEKKLAKTIIWVLDHFDPVGQSLRELDGVREKKQKHAWSEQIMNKLLEKPGKLLETPGTPTFLLPSTSKVNDSTDGIVIIESPLMIAAKNGVIKMVKAILEKFPSTVNFDEVKNEEENNIVLLAVEKRQSEVYGFLCKRENLWLTGSLFKQVDKEGNSALHLAAKYGGDRDWKFPGDALIIQWEHKWFEYVRNSMPPGVFATYNNKGETPDEIFKETHKDISEKDNKWLTKTANACSLVSTLIATVAFATAATVPGSFNQSPEDPTENGFPVFLHNNVYQLFVAMSLAALFFSLAATILLLSIVTARYHVVDFFTNLPTRLFLGMSSMFISIMCMWISFCSSHSFLLVQRARNVYIPLYILTSIPGTIFAIAKFPVYWNLLTSSFYKIPAPSHNLVPARPNLPKKKLTCAEALNRLVEICEDYEK